MGKNVVVYFGMGFLPDHNAVACREQALGHLAKEAGFIPVLIGIHKEVPFAEFEKKRYHGMDCYSIRYANTIAEKLKDTYVIEKTLVRIMEDIGVERIKCFMMQDYQIWPMKRMVRYCKAHEIAFSADIMDWFTPSRDYSLIKNISKTLDTYYRMHWFYPRLDNKIYITHKFDRFFRKSKQKNTMVLPCTCKDGQLPRRGMETSNQNITITFAGFLGRKCEKEKLDWLVRALYDNQSAISLNIIGITRETFEQRVPELADKITEHIHFCGYLPRSACVEILERSDFAVIVRKSSKLTEYGFSSKICEAFAHGIPVIATDISDNAMYIKNGINGYVCDANYESVKGLLQKIETLDRDEIRQMRHNVRESNPLSVSHYIDRFSAFIRDLII